MPPRANSLKKKRVCTQPVPSNHPTHRLSPQGDALFDEVGAFADGAKQARTDGAEEEEVSNHTRALHTDRNSVSPHSLRTTTRTQSRRRARRLARSALERHRRKRHAPATLLRTPPSPFPQLDADEDEDETEDEESEPESSDEEEEVQEKKGGVKRVCTLIVPL